MSALIAPKLLPSACGLPHWFPVDSPWLPYPMQYEITAVSKLFSLPYVPRVRWAQQETVIAAMSEAFRKRLTEQLGTLV